MTTIIHLTDTHISHSSPRKFRSADYEELVFGKLEWVREFAEQIDDPYIIHTGDVFDKPVQPISTTLRFADWWREFPQYRRSLVVGQHDIKGYSLATADESSIGVIERIGDTLTGWNCIEDDEMDLHIKKLDCTMGELLNEESPFTQTPHIVANHLSIHPNAYGCVHPNAVLWPGVKLCCCAHIHSGFEPMQNRKGTWFSAPGALVRLNADEMERQPKISVIEMNGAEVSSIEYVPVPCKPASLVFDMGAVEQSKTVMENRRRFIETIDEISAGGELVDMSDWRAALLGMKDQVGADVVERLSQYCEKAG